MARPALAVAYANFTDGGASATIDDTCTSYTVVGAINTTHPAGNNIIIATLQIRSTDAGAETLTGIDPGIRLLSGENELYRNSVSMSVGTANEQIAFTILANQTDAPANVQYNITACSDVTAVSIESKIIVINNLSNAIVNRSGTVAVGGNTILKTLYTNFSAGSNAVLASIVLNAGIDGGTIPVNNLSIKRGDTILKANVFRYLLGTAAPEDTQAVLLMAEDANAPANAQYDVVGRVVGGSANAETHVLALQQSHNFTSGANVAIGTSATQLASMVTDFGAGSEVVVIATAEILDTDAGAETLAAMNGLNITQNDTMTVSSNEFQIQTFTVGGSAGDASAGNLLWLNKTNGKATNYTLRAKASATGLNGSAQILALWLNPSEAAGGPQQFDRTADDFFSFADANRRMLSGTRRADDVGTYADVSRKREEKPTSDVLSFADVDGRALTAVRLSPDLLSFAEAVARVLSGTRSADEAFVLADAPFRGWTTTRAITDLFAFADTVTREYTARRSPSDAITFVDDSGRQFSGIRSAPDTITFADFSGRTLSMMRVSEDVFILTDAAGKQLTIRRLGDDVIVFTDAAWRSLTVTRTFSDLLTFADLAGRVLSGSRTATDTATLTDAPIRIVTTTKSVQDLFNFADSVTRQFTSARTTSDAIVFVDDAGHQFSGVRLAPDVFSIIDLAGKEATLRRSSVDGLIFVDATGRQYTARRLTGEVITFIDATGREFSGTRSATDAVAFTDLTGRMLTITRTAPDTFVLTDAAGKQLTITRINDDTLSFTDASGRTLTVTRYPSDVLNFADLASRSLSGIRGATDTFILTGTAGRQLTATRISDDLVIFTDAPVRSATFNRQFAETFVLVDTVLRIANLRRSLADIIAFAEFVIAEKTGGGQQFDRTVGDILLLQDASSRQATLGRLLLDLFNFVDASSRQLTAVRDGSDVIVFADASNRQLTATRQSSDVLSFADLGGRTLTLRRIAEDTYVLMDDTGRTLTARRVTPDTISFTDAAGRTITVTRTGPDSIVFTDSSGRTLTATRTTTDTASLQDDSLSRRTVFREISESVILNQVAGRTATFVRLVGDFFSFIINAITSGGAQPAAPVAEQASGGGPPSPSFIVEYPPKNQTFFGIFSFEFARELVITLELRRNITPSVMFSEVFANNYGSAGLDNLTQFKIYDISLQPGTESDFVSMALNLSYDQRYVDRAAFFEDTLRWYSYDPQSGRWAPEQTVLDTRNNTIYARANHASLFGVFGMRNLTTPEEFIRKTGAAFAEKDFQNLMLGAVAVIFIALIILWRRSGRLQRRHAHSESARS